jgi:hypothetical protein
MKNILIDGYKLLNNEDVVLILETPDFYSFEVKQKYSVLLYKSRKSGKFSCNCQYGSMQGTNGAICQHVFACMLKLLGNVK